LAYSARDFPIAGILNWVQPYSPKLFEGDREFKESGEDREASRYAASMSLVCPRNAYIVPFTDVGKAWHREPEGRRVVITS
jgi:hypothetical protein